MKTEQSLKYKLNVADAKKIGKGALIAGVGAAAAYIIEALSIMDFGEYTPIAVAVLAVVTNLGRKFLQSK
jgi:hypothetical protein